MSNDALLTSLLAAVAASPTDVGLRLHVAGLLLDNGRPADALEHCSVVLQSEPTNTEALTLLQRASQALSGQEPAQEPKGQTQEQPHQGFDWKTAEEQISDIAIPPPFAKDGGEIEPVLDFESSTVTLADVGGLEEVKQRLNIAFLGPMRNPELAKAFGKSLRGGLMLYGPPGCGKTFIARAVAGELGANFTALSLADVLGGFIGDTERNIKEIFIAARRNAPCVLFFDEIDAIGHRRSKIGSGWTGLRAAVNQLLTEMDSVGNDNEGLFILAATNHPWDVDPALRRPGRLDRTVLVLPPDFSARVSILKANLANRPIAGINLEALAKRTEDFSGADLAHLCESATEIALEDSMKTGQVRPISMADLEKALRQIRPSIGSWLDTARNVALFANTSGEYDELVAYLKTRKLI